jgi:glycosyltransferase involved in cell wall biosynthesis
MRILIATNTYTPHLNGQAVFTANLAEGLVREGHRVTVLVPDINHTQTEIQNGVRIEPTPTIDLRFIHKEFFISWRYGKIVKRVFEEQKPELVHLQDPAPLSQMVLKEAHKRGIPVVATHHTGPAIWAPYLSEHDPLMMKVAVPILWAWIVSFLNQADKVTVPSRASVSMLEKHGLHVPVKPISCGVRLSSFNQALTSNAGLAKRQFGLKENKKHFLYVGRIDEEKRVDVLLKGLANTINPDVNLVVAGGGAAEELMVSLAKKLGLEDRVKFLGKVEREKLPALYAACDVFVMPGDVESLSIATLEAMACGKPIIAANAMALPEMVHPGKNGFLFTPRNPQDLGKKMDQLSDLDYRWSQMGAYSLDLVKSHDLSLTISRYADLYQNLSKQSKVNQHRPVWQRLPQILINPYGLAILAQWAITVGIILISLLTRSSPVVAASKPQIDILTPEMIQNIREILATLRYLDLPSNQANGVLILSNSLRNFLSLLRP